MVDLATLSDEELLAMSAAKPAAKPTDLSLLSDDELLAMAAPAELPQAQGWLEHSAEVARGITRGAQKTVELGFDIADIPIQAGLAAFNPKEGQSRLMAAGEAAWAEANPFGPETENDKLRNEYFWKPSEELRRQQYKSKPATAAEWAYESAIGPGKIALNLITGAAAGGGAVLGEAIGGETGEAIGGVTAALISPTKSIQRIFSKGENLLGGSSASRVDDDVFEYIRQNADNGDAALATFNKNYDGGMKGTVADLTEDTRLYNLEAAVPKGTKNAELLVNQQADFAQDTAKQINNTFGDAERAIPQQNAANQILEMDTLAKTELDDIAEVGRQGQARLTRAVEAADQGVIGATERAGAAETRFAGGTPLSPQASENAAGAFSDAENLVYTDTVRPAWDNFDKVAGEIDGLGPYNEVKAFEKSGDLTGTDLLGLKSHKDIYKKINNWVGKADDSAPPSNNPYVRTPATKNTKTTGKQIKPSEVQSVISDIRTKIAVAKQTGGIDNDLRILGKLADKLDEGLKNGASTSDEAAAAYTNAKKIHADYIDKFRTGKSGKAAFKEPTTFGKNVFTAGDEGKTSAQQLKKMRNSTNPKEVAAAETAIEGVKNYIRAQANEAGVVTKAWQRRYAPFLNEFDDLAKEVDDVVGAQSALTKTKQAQGIVKRQAADEGRVLTQSIAAKTKEAGEKAKGLRNSVQNVNLRKFSETPNTTIKSILKQEDNAADDLAALAEGVGDKDGFVRVLGDSLAEQADKWEALRPKVSGVLSKSQVDELDSLVNRTNVRATKRGLAANTQQQMDESGKVIEDVFINVASAVGATSLPGTHALIYGGKIKQWLKGMVGSAPSAARQDQLLKVMSNPDEFAKLIAREGPPTNQKEFNRLFNIFVQQGAENANE